MGVERALFQVEHDHLIGQPEGVVLGVLERVGVSPKTEEAMTQVLSAAGITSAPTMVARPRTIPPPPAPPVYRPPSSYYSADEPPDYWNERGYSRYDGL